MSDGPDVQKLGSYADRVREVCPVCNVMNSVTAVCWWETLPDGTEDHRTMDNEEVYDPIGTCEHFLERFDGGGESYLTFREEGEKP